MVLMKNHMCSSEDVTRCWWSNASQLNSRLFEVSNVGVDYYNITSSSRASANAFGGGSSVMASYNRKFEKVYALIPNLSFSQTKINSFVQDNKCISNR